MNKDQDESGKPLCRIGPYGASTPEATNCNVLSTVLFGGGYSSYTGTKGFPSHHWLQKAPTSRLPDQPKRTCFGKSRASSVHHRRPRGMSVLRVAKGPPEKPNNRMATGRVQKGSQFAAIHWLARSLISHERGSYLYLEGSYVWTDSQSTWLLTYCGGMPYRFAAVTICASTL